MSDGCDSTGRGDAPFATRRDSALALFAFAISAIWYFPFSQWISTTPVGTSLFLWGEIIYALPLIAAVPGIPILVICLLFQRVRRRAAFLLVFAVLLIPCCVAGIVLGHKTRMVCMRAFAQRSQPLIGAIRKYELDHSMPPQSLNDLVPEYLPAVPSTGMMAYPEFRYHTGTEARDRFANNAWALSVATPSGGINFDMVLYFPEQNYPDRGYGGSLERVGDWAYVHE